MNLSVITVIIVMFVIFAIPIGIFVYYIRGGTRVSVFNDRRSIPTQKVTDGDIFNKLEGGTVRKYLIVNGGFPYDSEKSVNGYADSLHNSKFMKECVRKEGLRYNG